MQTLFSVVCTVLAVTCTRATPYPFDVTTLTAPDRSIYASFVSIGATLTELWVPDKNGTMRDVLGYDDNMLLLTDPQHPYYNAIIGRYANRIKNGTFTIGKNVYHTPINDALNVSTLHGGTIGWDRRNWTIVFKSDTSVTYKHVDTADEGFPGDVTVFVTHSVSNGGILHSAVHATATELTPIMVTQHIYWNLDAFLNPNGTINTGNAMILGHFLRIPASRVLAVDGAEIPTGALIDLNNASNADFDFCAGKLIETAFNDPGEEPQLRVIGGEINGITCFGAQASRGFYDNAWIYDDPLSPRRTTTLISPITGIQLDILTNQPAMQIYTTFLDEPRKAVHGGPNLTYDLFSAVALEQEGWLDAINTPAFHVDQIYGLGREFDWSATYQFSVK
ncbi:Galactose mutarotase-like protein [Mycena venus]|uniref:Galactose mutarotase-like protein n=1 Tax=Mycena venus TaxID=2733690 RepID=A0A8H6YL95_9AGAR|nr:Galactose mutarotase-like protein [Mycena venus]